MCTMFSNLQKMTKWTEDKQRRWIEAVDHIKVMAEIYRIQIEGGRWFLHEHPASATSWGLKVIQELAKQPGVEISVADQCMYDLKTWSRDGKRLLPAKKTTKFMTNCRGVSLELQRRCDKSHEHQQLLDGRAKHASRYTPELCKALCRGLLKEKHKDNMNVKYLCSVSASDRLGNMEDNGKSGIGNKHLNEDKVAEAEIYLQAWDDVLGEPLNPKQGIEARLLEVDYIKRMGVWIKITRSEALAKQIKILGTRWIDVNKGDKENQLLRSRLVGQDFKDGEDESLYASTPPLEALRLLISETATIDIHEDRYEKIMMFNDVSRACF